MNKIERIQRIKELLIKGNNLKLGSRTFKAFGYQFNYYTECFGDLNAYYFNEHEVAEMLVPNGLDNRPGIIKDKTLYVCVHDTASAADTAGALAHAKYVTNGGGGTSWHYSCGDDMIYHHIPDNEVAYHAGDGTKVSYHTIDTGVKATTKVPCIEIIDGHFYLNGNKSNISIPDLTVVKVDDELYYSSCGVIQGKVRDANIKEGKIELNLTTKDINDAGINTLIINGNYHFTPIYYNKSYGFVANRLGNLYSIGIETMVNRGSNLLVTWHKCAKLVAHLLKDNNLCIDAVKPHHYFSGKPCPMTMRYNKMWDYFMSMVEVEFEILKLLSSDIKITLNANKKNNGGVLLEEVDNLVSYEIIIESCEIVEKFTLN